MVERQCLARQHRRVAEAICVTQLASRIDLVAPASPVSAVHDSNHGFAGLVQSTKWSATPAVSMPSSSARTTRSRSTGHETFGRNNTPKRIRGTDGPA